MTEVRNEALDRAARGQDAQNMLRAIRGILPGRTDDEYRTAIREAIEQEGGGRVLMQANRSYFSNPASLLGCADPKAIVRVSISVTMTFPDTGEVRRHYVDAIDLDTRGQLGKRLDRAIQAVLDDAVGKKYRTKHVDSGMRSGPTRYQIHTAECV